jgi:hypothetical protein
MRRRLTALLIPVILSLALPGETLAHGFGDAIVSDESSVSVCGHHLLRLVPHIHLPRSILWTYPVDKDNLSQAGWSYCILNFSFRRQVYSPLIERLSSCAACSIALLVASLTLNLATSLPFSLRSTTVPRTLTKSNR